MERPKQPESGVNRIATATHAQRRGRQAHACSLVLSLLSRIMVPGVNHLGKMPPKPHECGSQSKTSLNAAKLTAKTTIIHNKLTKGKDKSTVPL